MLILPSGHVHHPQHLGDLTQVAIAHAEVIVVNAVTVAIVVREGNARHLEDRDRNPLVHVENIRHAKTIGMIVDAKEIQRNEEDREAL